MDNAPHAAVDYILKNRAEYAQAKAKRVYLEEFRKSKKSILMKEAMVKGFEAVTAQEREAYAHPEYLALLEGLEAAVAIEEKLKWGMEAARMRIDIYRTEEASNRLLMKATE